MFILSFTGRAMKCWNAMSWYVKKVIGRTFKVPLVCIAIRGVDEVVTAKYVV